MFVATTVSINRYCHYHSGIDFMIFKLTFEASVVLSVVTLSVVIDSLSLALSSVAVDTDSSSGNLETHKLILYHSYDTIRC